eukprot:scaffold9256_cov113-Isochrysis_galbana.AAC.5
MSCVALLRQRPPAPASARCTFDCCTSSDKRAAGRRSATLGMARRQLFAWLARQRPIEAQVVRARRRRRSSITMYRTFGLTCSVST